MFTVLKDYNGIYHHGSVQTWNYYCGIMSIKTYYGP